MVFWCSATDRQHHREAHLLPNHKCYSTTGSNPVILWIVIGGHCRARHYEWTPEPRAAVDEALKARPVDIAPFLFCTRNSQGYVN